MEVYTLDSAFRRNQMVELFESFIWTERFRAWGDFTISLQSTRENRNLLSPGTWISQSDSHRVMGVETVEDITDEEGRSILKISGRSLEAILDSRLARDTLSDLTTEAKWIITDVPADIARTIFNDICVTGNLDDGDIIPFLASLTSGTVYPSDTIPEPSDVVTYEIEPQTVYSAIRTICEIYDMGFRLYRHNDLSVLAFDIYMGSDRSTQQTTLPAVVFSPDLDNLKNTSELTTTALYKNVAYVISPVGHEIVYALDVDPSTAGFDRKVLFVKADDIQDVDPGDASDRMIQRGTEELAKARRFTGFDGVINQNAQYRAGVDYNLGDLVELQSPSGASIVMQVTEQIFVQDKEGIRGYPTLSINKFIIPGSWDDWVPDESWDSVDPDLVWDDAE